MGATEATVVEVQEEERDKEEVVEEEEEGEKEAQLSSKVRRCDEEEGEGPYNHQLDSALREELRRRLFKVKGRRKSEMILLLEEDDKNQMKIVLSKKYMGRGRGQKSQGGE